MAEALDESHEQFIRRLEVAIKYTSVALKVHYLEGRDVSVTKAAVEKLAKSFQKKRIQKRVRNRVDGSS